MVVVLDEKAETEEQCENGVCFSAEEEEHAVPDGFVTEVQPLALSRSVGVGVEIEMFDGVQQNDAHYGYSA